MSRLLRTGEAARILEVSDVTVRAMVREGKLAAQETPLGMLFDPAEVERVRAERAAKTTTEATA